MNFVNTFQQGCTGVSWVVKKLGGELPGEYCCDEHDVAYDEGGSLKEKIKRDAKLASCIFSSHRSLIVSSLAASGAWLAVTFFPYSYYIWFRSQRLASDSK